MVERKDAGWQCRSKVILVYLVAFVVFNGAFVILWLFSLSWTVGLVFFIPLTLTIVAVTLAIVGLLFGFAQ